MGLIQGCSLSRAKRKWERREENESDQTRSLLCWSCPWMTEERRRGTKRNASKRSLIVQRNRGKDFVGSNNNHRVGNGFVGDVDVELWNENGKNGSGLKERELHSDAISCARAKGNPGKGVSSSRVFRCETAQRFQERASGRTDGRM